jgi:hypothetical protein
VGARGSSKRVGAKLVQARQVKKRSVSKELHNSNWIRNLQGIHTTEQLEEFTLLFMALEDINLNDQDGLIRWRWTSNNCYSVALVCDCQFLGAMVKLPAVDNWKAKTEQKCKFFVWLVLHNRALTTDNMIKKGWLCNHVCSLCECMSETTSPLANLL